MTQNAHLLEWVDTVAKLTKPDRIVWCDGSEEEKKRLTEESVASGLLIPLNPQKLPGCYLHRSNPNDVARVEQLTFICTPTNDEAGPTNNWMAPKDAYDKLEEALKRLDEGPHDVRHTLRAWGPSVRRCRDQRRRLGQRVRRPQHARSWRAWGRPPLEMLGDSNDFNHGLHSTLDTNPERRFICHFPQDNTIWSVGSGYGGNVLLGKKCLALRVGSYLGKKEGWLAEHMLILGVESPEGEMTYVAAAFPSACGKTNFAMMIPPARFKGWKIWTVGDDICWMRVGEDGRLWAINPEAGYFGVAPGTSMKSNPNAMKTISRDTIYTNVAMTKDGDVWWEGKDGDVPDELTDWQGRPWKKGSTEKAAHPNSRFTAPAANNPALSRFAEDPQGVPIGAIIFGGRRATTVPARHAGLQLGARRRLPSARASAARPTAAAAGKVGVVRRDPMAMLPFCGYNMGEYFARPGSRCRAKIGYPPKVFVVNWFRQGCGEFLWPGECGENMRVLKWICVDRARAAVGGQEDDPRLGAQRRRPRPLGRQRPLGAGRRGHAHGPRGVEDRAEIAGRVLRQARTDDAEGARAVPADAAGAAGDDPAELGLGRSEATARRGPARSRHARSRPPGLPRSSLPRAAQRHRRRRDAPPHGGSGP